MSGALTLMMAAGGLKAFPFYLGSGGATGDGNANTEAPAGVWAITIVLPVVIDPNDLLLLFLALSTTGAAITPPAGWTLLCDDANGTDVRLVVFQRTATGGEDGAIESIEMSGASRYAYRIVRYSGVSLIQTGTAATGTSTAPDSSNLTPPWSSRNTTWITAFAIDGNTADPVTDPSLTVDAYNENDAASGCGLGFGYIDLNAASYNPGAWAVSASEQWVAQTIALAG